LVSRKVDYRNLRKAFVKAIKENTKFKIITEPKTRSSYRPDLILSDNQNKIMIELKSSTYPQKSIDALYQIIGYDRISPDRFDTLILIIPKTSLTLNLMDLINMIQQELSKIQVFTYYTEEDKIIFNQTTQTSTPLPDFLSSDLPFSLPATPRRKRVSLSYPKSMRIVRYLLTNKNTTQTEIADKTNVSIGLVNKIVTYLVENNMARYKRRNLVLTEPWKLLNEIAWSRNMEQLRTGTYFMPDRFSTTEELEEKIKQIFNSENVRYSLTLFSAASRYTSYMKKYDVIQLYAEHLSESLKKVLIQELNPDSKGQIQLEIFEPDSIEIFRESSNRDGFRVCSKIQTVIDLYCFGNIGRDLAIELYSKIRGELI